MSGARTWSFDLPEGPRASSLGHASSASGIGRLHGERLRLTTEPLTGPRSLFMSRSNRSEKMAWRREPLGCTRLSMPTTAGVLPREDRL